LGILFPWGAAYAEVGDWKAAVEWQTIAPTCPGSGMAHWGGISARIDLDMSQEILVQIQILYHFSIRIETAGFWNRIAIFHHAFEVKFQRLFQVCHDSLDRLAR
jgi:hypothetical protein